VPQFRNIGPGDVQVGRPEGHPESHLVEHGKTVDVPGTLVKSRPKPKDDEPPPEPLPDDAYIVEHNGEERAWSHAWWELVEDKPDKSKKSDTVKEN
jgi:hypothetical protein